MLLIFLDFPYFKLMWVNSSLFKREFLLVEENFPSHLGNSILCERCPDNTSHGRTLENIAYSSKHKLYNINIID